MERHSINRMSLGSQVLPIITILLSTLPLTLDHTWLARTRPINPTGSLSAGYSISIIEPWVKSLVVD